MSASYREQDIVFEQGGYWVLRVDYGFDVYRTGLTHSTRCARIGFKGETGVCRAQAEIARRLACDSMIEVE